MEIVAGDAIAEEEGSVLAVPVFADRTWGPGCQWVLDQLGSWVETYLDERSFSGKSKQLATLPGADRIPYGQVMFVGLGDEIDIEGLRRAAAALGRATTKHQRVVTTLHQVDIDDAAEAVAFGYKLGQYRFDKYLSESEAAATETLVLSEANGVGDAIRRADIVADAVALARDLVNEPAVGKPPVALAARAQEIAAEHGLSIRVYDENDIVEERFGGLAAVASGATNPARMVVMEHAPDDTLAHIAIVGKGIVFDSGGLSLKPAKSMEDMKTDMSGAAAVFATMGAVAALELPVRVTGIAPLTENMTGGRAQRPGDIMRARNGKTIEVLNTDAEGRLVLADGLSLAVEAEPDVIVDVATLTGACAVALGRHIAGMWSNNDATAEQVLAASRRAGEKVWRMPLEQEYRTHIDSDIADMKNTGDRYGSAISASLLLEEFVDERPWAHIDIAGPARATKAEHYLAKGATGFGVRTLIALVEDLAAG